MFFIFCKALVGKFLNYFLHLLDYIKWQNTTNIIMRRLAGYDFSFDIGFFSGDSTS